MDEAAELHRALIEAEPSLSDPTLGEALVAFVETARAQWPNLAADARAFVAFVAERLLGDDAHERLAALRPGDLWLAFACSRGDEASIRTFSREMAPEFRAALRDPSARGTDAVDLEQRVLARLFAARPGERPKIHEYGGRGPLGRWVRIVALRVRADSERKRGDKEADLGAFEQEIVDGTDDVELAYLKQHYREAFREAFARAVAALTARDRTLLRLQVVHGRSATAIAEIFAVHRATAKRWLADIRARLLTATRDGLRQSLEVDARELDSIMRLIQSRLEASVRTHLATSSDEGP